MESVNTYLAPGSIDVATLVVGLVFLAFFVAAASVLARHHLGILTAIVGAGIWLLSRLLLANEQGLVAYLGPLVGSAQAQLDVDIVRSANRLAPWIFGLGIVIAIGALVFHRVEAAVTPAYEPLEDQHDSLRPPDIGGHAAA